MTDKIYDEILDIAEDYCQDLDNQDLKSIVKNQTIDDAEDILKDYLEVEITEDMVNLFIENVVQSAEYFLEDIKREVYNNLESEILEVLNNCADLDLLDDKDIAYILISEASNYINPNF